MAFALTVAGTCYAAALVCCAGGRRALLPASLPLHDAVARYGVGSLANTFLPGRAGDAIRISLFGRVVPAECSPSPARSLPSVRLAGS